MVILSFMWSHPKIISYFLSIKIKMFIEWLILVWQLLHNSHPRSDDTLRRPLGRWQGIRYVTIEHLVPNVGDPSRSKRTIIMVFYARCSMRLSCGRRSINVTKMLCGALNKSKRRGKLVRIRQCQRTRR